MLLRRVLRVPFLWAPRACRLNVQQGLFASRALLPERALAGICKEEGWHDYPAWSLLLQGTRPAPADDAGPGDWPYRWQMHVSRTRNTEIRERVLLPDMSPSSQAFLRSPAGSQAGAWLAAIPTFPNRAGHNATTSNSSCGCRCLCEGVPAARTLGAAQLSVL